MNTMSIKNQMCGGGGVVNNNNCQEVKREKAVFVEFLCSLYWPILSVT